MTDHCIYSTNESATTDKQSKLLSDRLIRILTVFHTLLFQIHNGQADQTFFPATGTDSAGDLATSERAAGSLNFSLTCTV
jgi:hypothetical protein